MTQAQAPPAAGNIDIVRRAYDHFRATGQFDAELLHPDFVWDMSSYPGWPEEQTYSGLDGATRFMSDWLDAWDEWEWEVRSLRSGGDKVVAILHQAARAKSTGVRVEMDFAQVFTLADGRQIRMEAFADADEALAAAGLTP